MKKAVVTVFYSLMMCSFGTFAATPAYAQVAEDDVPSWCFAIQIESDAQTMCDVTIDKQVSVNGGPFADADEASTAANAIVGDTVTWKITLIDASFGYMPYLELNVHDVLPAGVEYVSHTATVGTYDQSDWIVPTATLEGEFDYETTLPATLTIVTKATAVGTWENISAVDGVYCDGKCQFEDFDGKNDANSAFVTVSTPSIPQVLGDSTTTPQVLAATGTISTFTSVMLGAVTILLTSLLFIATRKKSFEVSK